MLGKKVANKIFDYNHMHETTGTYNCNRELNVA